MNQELPNDHACTLETVNDASVVAPGEEHIRIYNKWGDEYYWDLEQTPGYTHTANFDTPVGTQDVKLIRRSNATSFETALVTCTSV